MKVDSLTIVGGGTSGWLAAAFLSKNQPDIKIRVVDKEIGNAIGVGEATILTFKPFMEECGFDIDDWFVALDAGYKSGIEFTNWRHPGNNIWHPFYKGHRPVLDEIRIWDIWSLVQEFDFKKYALSAYDSCIIHNTFDPMAADSFAFHIDCGKLVKFLQEKLTDKVEMIKSDVVNVVRHENGDINFLELKNGSIIKSDLYVDCTGFRNVLRTPEHRNDLEGRLFVNTAVVCQVPYEDRENEFRSYAVCDAVDHGWIWKIGVSSRIGSGMVFNRNITDPEEAKEYFVNYWNNRIKKENVRVINWDPFYNDDQWKGNVVSIGLSAGFIEPLESTGVGLITVGISQLNNALQERWYSDVDRQNFNLQMKTLFEDAIDFVSMHYANNDRTSKFWNYVRETFKPSERMLHHVNELLNPNILVPWRSKYNYMFGAGNWTLLLQQLGYPVASRNIPFTKEAAAELLIKNYITHEKNRHIWCRPHAAEIDRITEQKLL